MKRLTIFASYDKYNVIDESVIFYLKELNKISDIIFVSDCDFSSNEISKIKSYCLKTICSKHGEYDFGSYKRGYIYAKKNNILENYNYLILCNDSMFGPFFNLKDICIDMEKDFPDAYGMYLYGDNETAPHPRHLQSYFISIKNNVFFSNAFDNFMNSITWHKDKEDIIVNYEIGLSKLFFNSNLNIKWKYCDTKEYLSMPHTNPYALIKNGFPFLKKTVLYNSEIWNFTIKDFYNILLAIYNNYDINIIFDNLYRLYSVKYIHSINIENTNYEELKLKCGWFSIFNIYNNSYALRIVVFGIKITVKMTQEKIEKFSRLIPVRKWRDNFREKFKMTGQDRTGQDRTGHL